MVATLTLTVDNETLVFETLLKSIIIDYQTGPCRQINVHWYRL